MSSSCKIELELEYQRTRQMSLKMINKRILNHKNKEITFIQNYQTDLYLLQLFVKNLDKINNFKSIRVISGSKLMKKREI